MPELGVAYALETGYAPGTYSSPWINVQDYCGITFTANATANYTMTVSWSVNDLGIVIDIDTKAVLANNAGSMYLPVKARYMQVGMIFSSNPCDFKNQVFFC